MTIPTYSPYFVFAGTAATVFANPLTRAPTGCLPMRLWPVVGLNRDVSRLGRCPAWLASLY